MDSEGEEEVIASNVLPDIVNHLLTSSSGVETACEMTGLATNSAILSLINNRMGRKRIDREAFEVRFKGWDWSMRSKQDPWYVGFHPRAAWTRAKRFFSRVE